MGNQKILFMIMIDGTNYEVFNSLLNNGQLPAFSSLMNEKEGCFKKALSTFPSTTAPAIPEILMGFYASKFKDLPKAIHAFDRDSLEIKRYEFLLDEWGKRNLRLLHLFREQEWKIISFFKANIRDSHFTYYNEILYQLEFISDFTGLKWINYDEVQIYKLIEFLKKDPSPNKLIFIVLNSADLNGHLFGPYSNNYSESIIKLDSVIGKLLEFLKTYKINGQRMFDFSNFIIFGDHGISPSGNHVNIERILRGYGYSTFDAGNPLSLITENIMGILEDDVDILFFPAGSNVADIYVRKIENGNPLQWKEFPTVGQIRHYPNRSKPLFSYDLKNIFSAIEPLDFLLLPEGRDVIGVYGSGDQKALIYRRRDTKPWKFLYQIPDGEDPLGYIQDEKLKDYLWVGKEVNKNNFNEKIFDTFFLTEEEWLELTWNHPHPNAPPLLSKAFDREDTRSDIILTAKEHFSFMRMVKGDHGALIPSSMFTILMILGNNINCSENAYPRIIDIFPTALKLSGLDFPELETDGRSLLI